MIVRRDADSLVSSLTVSGPCAISTDDKSFPLADHDNQKYFDRLVVRDGLRSRSLEPTPFDETVFHPMITVSQPPLTPTIPRYSLRQRHATFGLESDYETPEKIWLRAQRLSAIRRTESANLNTPSPRGVSRSHSSVSRTHFDPDATPKASLGAHSEVTPKAQFGLRKRAPPMRVELRTPLCQRKRIQPVKMAEVEAEKSTLAEIISKQTGVSLVGYKTMKALSK
ncbi:hypothetical protein TSMEX_008479 [Taenia solium]|eukprot:TsM_001121500 transcript=TsM_001121500 gene=TsM_001121500